MRPNPFKGGIVGAILLSFTHLAWALAVLLGVAQPLMDFIFRIHMLAPVLVVQPFRLELALLLIAVTAGIGFVGGVVTAIIVRGLNR